MSQKLKFKARSAHGLYPIHEPPSAMVNESATCLRLDGVVELKTTAQKQTELCAAVRLMQGAQGGTDSGAGNLSSFHNGYLGHQ